MKLKSSIVVLFFMAIQSFAYAQKIQGAYQLDTKKSKILWNTGKMMGGHSGYILFAWGNLQYSNTGEPVKGVFIIDMNSIRSTEAKEETSRRKTDANLRQPKFFSSDQYPSATVDIKKIKRIGNTSTFNVTADLTIKGISNPVDFIATIQPRSGSVFITANIGISRSLWDIDDEPKPRTLELIPKPKQPAAADIFVALDLVLVK
ncbi:YceI family protein [Sediminibacterium ginsengisoli]|uniref:Polyisoprenoid-binding protein YceI n=1 Tax=Sediminibacterium ginsengisoli TaxID=413434 RepID=A0A1T4R548_9BACT|nr:YceI family protein [Sediminibacterium ginsengisoli]SKA11039.1 Polyisoprenoid-binding protein YceI [Sediminibacterium ginsengisoli]